MQYFLIGVAATVRNFYSKYYRNFINCREIQIKFRETGLISDLRQSGRPSRSRSTENIEVIRKYVAESAGISIQHLVQELDTSRILL